MPLRVTYPTAIVMLAVSRGVRYGFDIMDASGLQSGTVYPVSYTHLTLPTILRV